MEFGRVPETGLCGVAFALNDKLVASELVLQGAMKNLSLFKIDPRFKTL